MFILFVLKGGLINNFHHAREKVLIGLTDPRKDLHLLAGSILVLVTAIIQAWMKLIAVNISIFYQFNQHYYNYDCYPYCLGAHSETFLLSDKTISISSDEGICNESLGKGNVAKFSLCSDYSSYSKSVLGSVENEEPPSHDSDPGPIDPLKVTLPPEWKYIDNKEEGFYFGS